MQTSKMKEDDIRPAPLLDEYFRLLKIDAVRLASESNRFVEVDCPFCGGSEREPAFRKDGFSYQLCRSCGSLYVTPRPTREQLARYYTDSEAVRFWSQEFYRSTAAARREKMFRPRARLIQSLHQSGAFAQARGDPVPGTTTLSMIDVGAGYGLFLQEVRALNLFKRIAGLEPEPRLGEICRAEGFEVIPKWAEEVPEGEQFSVATCFEVLEHVFSPVEFLAGCARLLRPGGVLVLTTLTIDGFDLQVLWDHSRSITPPQHLNFPSLRGASALLERAGLREEEISTPGELDLDIVRNWIAQKPEITVPQFVRQLAAAGERTRAEFQEFLQRHRMSSHLRCIASRSLAS
ncbi:MAG: methyltransferase domain-containing protein [Verrucomicrobiae bacterium]|nr:methyltransferase domain-containing protein [Verrucomicrobiae bacterium]